MKSANEKSSLIDLEAEMPTGGKQAKAVQPERLSGKTPLRVMRQSTPTGNELWDTVRYDGQPWWNSALTPLNSQPTLSPFVVLEDRA